MFSFLARMKAQRDEGGGRILLGDKTYGIVIMLQPIRFQCAGVWISNIGCFFLLGR
jgi:hypothetical protein